MSEIFEILSITREGGNSTEDDERVGLKVIPYVCSVGVGGLFPVVNTESVLRTSRIMGVEKAGNLMTVTTRNTTYVLRK